MNINATLFGQMITFALFVWFTWRFVWPPVTRALKERQRTIADGLAAAERGVRELEMAQEKVNECLQEAKTQAAHLLDEAHKRASNLVDESRQKGRQEGERLIALARVEIHQEVEAAKQLLRKELTTLAIAGAEKILSQKIDAQSNDKLFQQLLEQIAE